jgi:transcriptional regulator with XRE-family HTH domain
MIRDLRRALGWSQGRLAAELRLLHPTATRDMVKRWENGKREPGPFWRGHLATALMIPLRELEALVRRRQLFGVTAAVAGGAIAAKIPLSGTGQDLFASIAAGDAGPLAQVQTTHTTDLAIARLALRDRPAMHRLARWAEGGDTGVLRVNAAGILAKTPDLDAAGLAALLLRRDEGIRSRYLRAVSARVGINPAALTAELRNPRDAGARWCAAWLLSRVHSPAATRALAAALRTEPVPETIRTIGMLLNGDDPCT